MRSTTDGIDKNFRSLSKDAGERVDQEPNNARKHSASDSEEDAG